MLHKTKLTEVVLLTKTYNLQDFKDWLHWHLDIIGFECAHIFDNDSLVDIKSICDTYKGRVSYERVTGWANQYALYGRYINEESPAWWVLPIDDDEFLYVSNRYHNNINEFFVINKFIREHDVNKLCVGWRNLFPITYTENRIDPCLLVNAVGWSNESSNVWQCGNRPVKTFVLTVQNYEWADKCGKHKTHNPFTLGRVDNSYTLNGEIIDGSHQVHPTTGNEDLILYHYQFKCNSEWVYKCANRVSPGSRTFKKNFPDKYKALYDYAILKDTRMLELWSKYVLG